MKLITKEIEAKFKKLGSQENKKKIEDMEIVVKLFNPCGRQTWYVTNYDPMTRIATGWVSLFGDFRDEFGDFALWELEELKLMGGLGIERDLHFGEGHLLKEVMNK